MKYEAPWHGTSISGLDLAEGRLCIVNPGGETAYLGMKVSDEASAWFLILGEIGERTELELPGLVKQGDLLGAELVQVLAGGRFIIEPLSKDAAALRLAASSYSHNGAVHIDENSDPLIQVREGVQVKPIFNLATGKATAGQVKGHWRADWRLIWRFGDDDIELCRFPNPPASSR